MTRNSVPPWRARAFIAQNLAIKGEALARGMQHRVHITATGYVRDFHGDCVNPHSVIHYCAPLWGMRTKVNTLGHFFLPDIGDGCLEMHWCHPAEGKWHDNPLEEEFLQLTRVRCRKCPECLMARAQLWSERAVAEIKTSARTWLVTLTYRDKILREWLENGLDPEWAAGRELTLFLKRVRKAGMRCRFLAALERGTLKGRIHHHLLIHTSFILKKSDLLMHWTNGFKNVKLVRRHSDMSVEYAAFYVSKYITKSKTTRVRSSTRYGNNVLRT